MPDDPNRDLDPTIIDGVAVFPEDSTEATDPSGRPARASRPTQDTIETAVPFDAIAAARELDSALAGDAVDLTDPHASDYVTMLEGELETVNNLVAQREGELAAARAETAEARAELDRAVARVECAADKKLETRRRKILLGFLEVLDDLDRALAAAQQGGHAATVLEGVTLVRRRFLGKLAEFGVSHVPTAGVRFDPNVHEAVAVVPVADPGQDGMIMGVVREGYAIGEEILRPAGVAVGKKS